MKKLYLFLLFAAMLPLIAVAEELAVANEPFRVFEPALPVRDGSEVMSRSTLGIDDAIREAPEGKVTPLVRSGYAYYSQYGTLHETDYSGAASELVECDNGDVYLKNPVSLLPTNLYIKGRREGKKLVFNLPQVAYLEPYQGQIFPYKFTTCIYCKETDTFYPVNSADAAKYNLPVIDDVFELEIMNDGSFKYTAPENGDIIAGLVDIESDAWVGYGEMRSLWKPLKVTRTEAPAGLKTEDIAVVANKDSYYAKIGFDGNDVYVQGLFAKMPSAWVKGTLKGDVIEFASGQYIGVEPQQNAHVYFLGATYDSKNNSLDYAASLTFDYDKANGKMVAKSGQAAVLSGEQDKVAYLEYILNPEIQWIPSEMSYNPMQPVMLDYDYNDKYKDLCVKFDIPLKNEDGILLDKQYVYYSFYVDNELFVFKAPDYPTFKEDMSLFSYSFTDGREIMFLNGVHEAWFYFDEPKPVGIKSFYIKDGKVLGESKLLITSGIDDVIVDDAKDVESVEYFNISGQKVAKPTDGIFIKVTKYADGSRTTEKCAIR